MLLHCPYSTLLSGFAHRLSALDELQYHRIVRDFGNIESKGLQLRASSTELARVHAHIIEVLTHNALAESHLRDIAAELLTAEELARFEQELDEIRKEFFQAQKDTINIGSRQMTDNIRQQPIETAKQNDSDDFFEGMKDVLSIFKGGRKGK